MTDLEKKILDFASKHLEFDHFTAMAELAYMNETDPDLIANLWTLHVSSQECGEIRTENKWNSYLAYFLKITLCKPSHDFQITKRRTYGRSGFPDIDMDFDHLRRGEIVRYLVEKYGREYVGNIGNIQTLKTKAAVRRAVKVLDPTNSVHFDDEGKVIRSKVNENFALENEILQTLPNLMKRGDGTFVGSVNEACEEYPHFKQYMEKYPEVRRIATELEGTIAGFGCHAAGLILSPIPLSRIAPMHVTRKTGTGEDGKPERVIATQFPMAEVERMGLIKFDILGLSTKTVVNWACKYLAERDIHIDWNKIPLDDAETLELLHSGRTDGCFQLENPGMKECLKMIGIDSFDDLVVAVAMYRPGPKDYIPEFAGRKRKRVAVSYPHDLLKDITEGTHGIIVYQEQVMKVFMVLAGLTASDGYSFMKGCAKKKTDIIEGYKDKFFKGSIASGLTVSTIQRIWDDLYKFSGYAFNKSLQWNEKIITTKQEYSIQELYNMKQRGKELPQVFSSTGDLIDIVDVYDHGILSVYKITFDDGSSVSSTMNHKFMTQKGVLPLHQILNENLEVIQNIGVINGNRMDMQRVRDSSEDSAQITGSPEGMCGISSDEIQSKALCMLRMQRRDSGTQGTSCSQKRLSVLERGKESALQQAKQNKWSEVLGTDFTRSSASRGVESENQPIGSASCKYARRKEASFRINEQSQQEISYKVSAKQGENRNKNISQKRYSKKASGSVKKMERRESRKILSPVYCETRQESMEIERRGVFTGNSRTAGFSIQSVYIQRGVSDKISPSPSGLHLARSKDYCRVRWGAALPKWIFRKFKHAARQEVQQGFDRSRLFGNSNFLRHMAVKQEKIQIPAVSRVTDDSYVLSRQGYGQNNWQSLRIQKIKFLGYEQCYDLEIASNDHLYCLANGVVTSNSHSVSYAYESYKTAYLKAHHPTEFIAARLSVETRRRNFDNVEKYKKDAVKHFGFVFEPVDINRSKIDWSIEGEKNLRAPILVKGVGIKAAEDIVLHQPYTGKNLLLSFGRKVGKAVNSKVIEAMKDAGFWKGIAKGKLIVDFDQIRKDKKRMCGRTTMDLYA